MFTRIAFRRFHLTATASAMALLAACVGGPDSPNGSQAFSPTPAADKTIVFQGATATVRATVAGEAQVANRGFALMRL